MANRNPYLVAKTTDTNTNALILQKLANRHCQITGATGSGKTVSLQLLAEGFSRRGVRCFTAHVKADRTVVWRTGGGTFKYELPVSAVGACCPSRLSVGARAPLIRQCLAFISRKPSPHHRA